MKKITSYVLNACHDLLSILMYYLMWDELKTPTELCLTHKVVKMLENILILWDSNSVFSKKKKKTLWMIFGMMQAKLSTFNY